MATLVKKGSKYYSKIQTRVGDNKLQKKKIVYVKLATDKYPFAKKRNIIVNSREQQIRLDIRKGYASKSDLLNINETTDWSWVKADGSTTQERLVTISDYVDKFIKYKTIKKMRDATIDSYRYALNKFIKSIGSNYLVSDINQENIDDFVEYLERYKYNENKLSLSSIDSNLKSISAFLNWCHIRGYIDTLPIIELNRPILDDKWLTESEYNSMINYDEYSDSRFPKMFKLYGETGMRLSEGFYGVLTEDSNGIWLAIHNEASKSGKGRTIQLTNEQADTIRLIQGYWLDGGQRLDHIKYYSKMFRKVRDKIGIDKHKSFHSLRHYFGKTQVTISGNIYKVSGLMGHSSVKVTEDNYVKGFDRKSTLRDFPSLKRYLVDAKNTQNIGEYTQESIPKQHKQLD
jgi:integrase/recombinase XerD